MRLSWTAPALADLRRIGGYLEREATPEVSVRTLERIRSRSSSLSDFPSAGPRTRDNDVRPLRVHDTPYILLYRVAEGRITILRVRHEREDWRPNA